MKAIGVLGVSTLGTTGTVQARPNDGSPGSGSTGKPLYTPPKDVPSPGALYPRFIRLGHADSNSSRKSCKRDQPLLATFEHYQSMDGGATPYFPIYRSLDGGQTWSKFSEIHDKSGKGWGLRYQPTLYELPQKVGPWSAGTILAAGNCIPTVDDPNTIEQGEYGELGETSIDLYASQDYGKSWEYISTVVTGGQAYPHAGNDPVWEPELRLDAEGDLICYFADERQGTDDDYNQLVGFKRSEDGGQTWGDEKFVAAIPNGNDRPGMPSVAKLPNGTYMIAYEVVGSSNVDGEIRIKTSSDGRDWGDPTDLGQAVTTSDGRRFVNGPYLTWSPKGGSNGTLLLSGKQLVDEKRNIAAGNGSTLLATTDLNGQGDWSPIEAPLSFETEDEIGGLVFVGWTTPILPSPNGNTLIQMTSTAISQEMCEIRYASGPLKLQTL